MDNLLKHLHSNPKGHQTDLEKSKVITLKDKNLDKVIKELHDVKQGKSNIKESEHRANIGASPFSKSSVEKALKKN